MVNDLKPEDMEVLAVNFKDAGRLTSLSPYTIRAYVRTGKIRATRCGKRWLIPMEELRKLVRQGIQ
jgi:excisionase family DNA binding protein